MFVFEASNNIWSNKVIKAEIDLYGNLNSTMMGKFPEDYLKPTSRLNRALNYWWRLSLRSTSRQRRG